MSCDGEALEQLKRAGNIWLPWKRVTKDGKVKKVALRLDGRWASSTREEDWQGQRRAEAYVESFNADGLCFNVGLTPFTVFDIDCVGEKGSETAQRVQAFVQYFDSYTEQSPSGKGIHVLVRGELPKDHLRKLADFFGPGAGLEVYQSDRYLTWTGRRVAGGRIEERQARLDLIYRRRLKPQGRPAAIRGRESRDRTDESVLEAIERRQEWALIWEGQGADESRDDWGLVKLLTFLSGDDAQVDRLFRLSGCMRDKWDQRRGRLSYGELTVQRARGSRAGGV